MTTHNKTLADVRPGGRVRLGDAPWPEIDAILADAYSAGATGLPFEGIARRHAVRAAIAALSSQPSPGGQGDALRVIAERLRGAGASLPAPPITGTIEGSMVTGLSIALALVEEALAARQPSKQPDSVALGEATEFCIEKGGRQSVGEPIAFVSSDMLVSLLKVRSHNWMPEVWALPNGTDSVPLYAVLPAQQLAQVYLDGLDRALGEAIDQRDRYHEVADDLAGHIAAITGVDIGEHSSANCPWQNAIEAAEEYKPAQAVDLDAIRDAVCGIALVFDGDLPFIKGIAEALALIDGKAVGK
ncbi:MULTISPECIES: hypothetical protein [unclassified Stenotrophomonas]|uniref:hypothetical protein n=1 Tax=unclassified Stenotrophomonas TaxID=196198 RepID=UPI00244B666E|nr:MULTISPECIES: hypothetical protein [unclassified Stenotrophomonas]MBN5158805.1 hypothetical protein [Stenotrophomonas maltophilia]MDG9843793.1 hypothetical protein [Stenotrophomonas sp. GD04054]MDH0016591.1 hypothetical protein [Stenotrophomonas sp. GD04028]MDH0577583.1 hypothetical protein [Stenotrophomonas sp. GD03997]MDH0859468.1 hypothetical protein [Stenotrophomonas sp. GD03882]